RSVRRALSTLPTGPPSAYSAFLSRILSSDRAASAKRLIGWVLCATRPLSTEELKHALSIEEGDKVHDANCLVDIDAIISSCEGVIVVDDASRMVRFVHYTFQEFLEKQAPEPSEQVHDEMAKSCLTYLLFQSFSTGRCSTDAEMDSRLAKHPFLVHASKSW